MKIYTTFCRKNKDTEQAQKHGIGFLLNPRWMPTRHMPEVPYAIDNGAFSYSSKGYPFLEGPFWKLLEKAYDAGIEPDFITVPDILAGGVRSLDLSKEYIRRMPGCNRCALVVQDGMEPRDVRNIMGSILFKQVSHLFLGGTVEWKWRTVYEWREFATNEGKMFHIGQCGNMKTIRAAAEAKADSCDSANFARNNSWHLLDVFRSVNRQSELFEHAIEEIKETVSE